MRKIGFLLLGSFGYDDTQNGCFLASSSFAIYLKVYWNGRTVFLFIIFRVYLTILAVTWLFFQVFSEISLINRCYYNKRITRTSNTVCFQLELQLELLEL